MVRLSCWVLLLIYASVRGITLNEKWVHKAVCDGYCHSSWMSGTSYLECSTPLILGATTEYYYAINANDGSTIFQNDNPTSNLQTQPSPIGVKDFQINGDCVGIMGFPDGILLAYDALTGNEIFRYDIPHNIYDSRIGSVAIGKSEDGDYLVFVGTDSPSDSTNLYVFDNEGNLLFKRPERIGDEEYDDHAQSCSGVNIALADVNNDGLLNVIVPSDEFTICAYNEEGDTVKVSDELWYRNYNHTWGAVIFTVDGNYEQGYWYPDMDLDDKCSTFQWSPASVFSYDEKKVIAVVGRPIDMSNCDEGWTYCTDNGLFDFYPYALYLLNHDRTRFTDPTNQFDWTVTPLDECCEIERDGKISQVMPNPAILKDPDASHLPAIIYPSSDSKVHFYTLEKEEPYDWPIDLSSSNPDKITFATESVVYENPEDGYQTIVFTTFTENDAGEPFKGYIYFVSDRGEILLQEPIPDTHPNHEEYANLERGSCTPPTLARLQSGGNLHLSLQTQNSGHCMFEILGTENAEMIWETSRADFHRTGFSKLSFSSSVVNPDDDQDEDNIDDDDELDGGVKDFGVYNIFLFFCLYFLF